MSKVETLLPSQVNQNSNSRVSDRSFAKSTITGLEDKGNSVTIPSVWSDAQKSLESALIARYMYEFMISSSNLKKDMSVEIAWQLPPKVELDCLEGTITRKISPTEPLKWSIASSRDLSLTDVPRDNKAIQNSDSDVNLIITVGGEIFKVSLAGLIRSTECSLLLNNKEITLHLGLNSSTVKSVVAEGDSLGFKTSNMIERYAGYDLKQRPKNSMTSIIDKTPDQFEGANEYKDDMGYVAYKGSVVTPGMKSNMSMLEARALVSRLKDLPSSLVVPVQLIRLTKSKDDENQCTEMEIIEAVFGSGKLVAEIMPDLKRTHVKQLGTKLIKAICELEKSGLEPTCLNYSNVSVDFTDNILSKVRPSKLAHFRCSESKFDVRIDTFAVFYAPEVFSSSAVDYKKNLVWNIGVFLYGLLYNKHPLAENAKFEVGISTIKDFNGAWDSSPCEHDDVSKAFFNMIFRKETERIDFESLASHKWFFSMADSLPSRYQNSVGDKKVLVKTFAIQEAIMSEIKRHFIYQQNLNIYTFVNQMSKDVGNAWTSPESALYIRDVLQWLKVSKKPTDKLDHLLKNNIINVSDSCTLDVLFNMCKYPDKTWLSNTYDQLLQQISSPEGSKLPARNEFTVRDLQIKSGLPVDYLKFLFKTKNGAYPITKPRFIIANFELTYLERKLDFVFYPKVTVDANNSK